MTGANDRVMSVAEAHKLENPERLKWLPPTEILQLLPLRAGDVVADIGAGTGYFALPLANMVGERGRVIAVDLQTAMLDLLRNKLASPGAPANISLVNGSAAATTLADEACDLVFITNVWHEVPDHAAALREFRRILKPGGSLAIVDWRPDAQHPPGPPLEHRIAATEVRGTLEAHRWKILKHGLVASFSYYFLAQPA
jgi:ubiquinone/menaquinone biosynthesis C-methylase UbiE